MKRQQTLRILLALLVMFGALPAVQAADDVLNQIPDDALAFVVVKNMDESSRKVSQLGQRMRLGATNLLVMTKENLGVTEGLEDAGEIAFALIGREGGSPFPVVLLRTSDYQALIRQMDPDDEQETISEVSVAADRMLVAKKGPYAVFTQPIFRDGLTRVLESKQSIKLDKRTQRFVRNADVYAVATRNGVVALSQQAIDALRMFKQQLAQQDNPQTETVVAGLNIYEELFKWATEEVGQVAGAVQIHESGAVSLMKRVAFRRAGEKSLPGSTVRATQALGSLPNWPYVMAMSGEMADSKTMERWIQLSIGMMRGTGTELNDEQIKELVDASRSSLQGMRGMSFVFGVPKPDASIYSRMGMVVEAEDAKAYLDNYLKATRRMQKLFEDNERMPYRILSAEGIEIDEAAGLKVVMQISPTALGPANEKIKEMMDKLYGKDGRVEVYAAPIDARRVAMAYVSKENLRVVMRAAKSKQQGLGQDAGIQSTAQLLPKKAHLVGYFSAAGMTQYAQRILNMLAPSEQLELAELPAFPSSPPLGVSITSSGAALDMRLVAPAESLEALGVYIDNIRQGTPQ